VTPPAPFSLSTSKGVIIAASAGDAIRPQEKFLWFFSKTFSHPAGNSIRPLSSKFFNIICEEFFIWKAGYMTPVNNLIFHSCPAYQSCTSQLIIPLKNLFYQSCTGVLNIMKDLQGRNHIWSFTTTGWLHNAFESPWHVLHASWPYSSSLLHHPIQTYRALERQRHERLHHRIEFGGKIASEEVANLPHCWSWNANCSMIYINPSDLFCHNRLCLLRLFAGVTIDT